VNRLVDRLLRFECAMAESSDWSDYHQADKKFHQLVGTASGLGNAVEAHLETLAELYATSSRARSSRCTNRTATTSRWWQPCVPAK
jgi:DNA-binding GntR family transcriptional regulator